MSYRLNLRRLPLLALVSLLFSLVVIAPSWALQDSNSPCENFTDPALAVAGCDPIVHNTPSMRPAPTATASQTTAPAPSKAATPSATSSTAVAPQAGASPTSNAEDWTKSMGEGMPQATKLIADRLDRKSNMGTGFFTAYSITFAIGCVIFAAMLLLQLSRASHQSPRSRADLLDAFPKFALWAPLVSIAPAIIVWLWNDVAQPLAATSTQQAGSAFKSFLGSVGTRFLTDPLWFLNAGVAVIMGFFMLLATLLMMVTWWIQDQVAEIGLYLLTLLIPIASALSLNPKWNRMLSRIIGVVLGCMLTPVVTRFSFWVMWLMMGDKVAQTSDFMLTMLKLLIILSVSCSSPIVLSYFMPHILPNGGATYGGQGGSSSMHARDALANGGDALRRMTSGMKQKGAAEAGAKVAGATAAKGAAARGGIAALGGPAGIAALAAAKAVGSAAKAVESAARSGAAQQLAAGGGGHTSDTGSNITAPLPAGLGGGAGQQPAPIQTDSEGNQIPNPADGVVATTAGAAASKTATAGAGTGGGAKEPALAGVGATSGVSSAGAGATAGAGTGGGAKEPALAGVGATSAPVSAAAGASAPVSAAAGASAPVSAGSYDSGVSSAAAGASAPVSAGSYDSGASFAAGAAVGAVSSAAASAGSYDSGVYSAPAGAPAPTYETPAPTTWSAPAAAQDAAAASVPTAQTNETTIYAAPTSIPQQPTVNYSVAPEPHTADFAHEAVEDTTPTRLSRRGGKGGK